MGFFHKTLGDAIKALEERDTEKAMRILDGHIKADLRLESDINKLIKSLRDYQEYVIQAANYAQQGNSSLSMIQCRQAQDALRLFKLNIQLLNRKGLIKLE